MNVDHHYFSHLDPADGVSITDCVVNLVIEGMGQCIVTVTLKNYMLRLSIGNLFISLPTHACLPCV